MDKNVKVIWVKICQSNLNNKCQINVGPICQINMDQNSQTNMGAK